MRRIILTHDKVALVDGADFGALNKFRWAAHRHQNGTWYAERSVYIGRF